MQHNFVSLYFRTFQMELVNGLMNQKSQYIEKFTNPVVS